MKPLYCITAINKLTREREKVSCMSQSISALSEIKEKFLKTSARNRTHIYPIIRVVETKIFK